MLTLKLCLILIGLLTSCDEFLVEDITNDKIVLLTPGDSLVISTQTPTFWWKDVPGADSYEMIIVSSILENPDALILDSLIKDNKLTTTLPYGRYQWCVRAINSEFYTEYSCRVLELKN